MGLNLEFFSNEESITELIRIVEESIRNELDEILGLRTDEYIITIGIEVDREVRITIDLDVKAHLHRKINLCNIVDKVIDHAFSRARVYLKQFARKSEESNPHI